MRAPRRRPEAAPLRPHSAPAEGDAPTICPHCWMVNPGPFRLCGRCGADMGTVLQESGGLRRTAPVQSPVPQPGVGGRSLGQRVVLALFVVLLALSWLAQLVPPSAVDGSAPRPVPASGES